MKNVTFAHCSKSSFFVQKFNFDFPWKIVDFLGWKTRENVVGSDFLAVDNFDFTRKIVKKKFGVKNSWKCWGFVKIEFLDNYLTFRIVCQCEFILFKSINFRAKSLLCISYIRQRLQLEHCLRPPFLTIFCFFDENPLWIWPVSENVKLQ